MRSTKPNHVCECGAALLPMLALVGGAACLSESLVLLKRIPWLDPMLTNAVGMTTGASFLLILSRVIGEAWRVPALPRTWIAILYIVLIGSAVFFSLVIFVVKRWTAYATSYALVLMPFETLALGAWLQGEQVGLSLLIGSTLVLAGVWIGALAPASPPALPQPAAVPATEGD